MTDDEGKKSSWEDLARQLGAQVKEAEAKGAAPPGERVERPQVAPRVALPSAPPPGAPSGWEALAKDFGIAAADTAREPAKAQPPLAEEPPRVVGDEADEFKTIAESTWQDESVEEWDTEVADQESDFLEADSTTVDSEDALEAIEEAEVMEDVSEPPTSIPAAGAAAGEEGELRVDEDASQAHATPVKNRAPSFWESIFGPRTQPESILREPVEKAGFREAREEAPTESEEKDAQLASDAGFSEPLAESDRDEQPRRRSRRRRRGRGRGGPEQRGEPREAPSKVRDEPEEDFDDEVLDDEEESDTDSRKASPGRGKTAGHRSIPTWSDAIGTIVETNLQSRSERRRTSVRSGGNRARPRGRRKKKS